MILRYNSLDHYLSVIAKYTTPRASLGEHWDHGVSGPEAVRRTTFGDPSIVARYEATIDRFTSTIAPVDRSGIVSDFMGSRVNVPAYLAGNPMHMKRRKIQERSARSVAVYVSTTSSAGVEADTLLNRGAAVLGLISTLQASGIDVELYMVVDLHGKHACRKGEPSDNHDMTQDGDLHQVIRIESKPLDLSTSGFAIAHPSFTRNVCYEHAYNYGTSGAWSRTFDSCNGHGGTDAYSKAMIQKLNLAPTDIFIPPTSLYDTVVANPIQWIEQRVIQALA